MTVVRHWSKDNGRARTLCACLSEVRVHTLPGSACLHARKGRLTPRSFQCGRCAVCWLRVSVNRVKRLASLAGIAAQIGYKRRPGRYGGQPLVVADNMLGRQFEVDAPDRIWVTDITYIGTMKAGRIWLWSSICSRGVSLAGPLSADCFARACGALDAIPHDN